MKPIENRGAWLQDLLNRWKGDGVNDQALRGRDAEATNATKATSPGSLK